METIQIAATERTPRVLLDFDNHNYSLSGESYPEDVSDFYSSMLNQLENHLGQLRDVALRFDFSFVYFNSSSTKVIMRLFEMLEETAQSGNQVVVNWYYKEGDEIMQEMGEEFALDLQSAEFHLLPMPEILDG